MSTDPSLRVSQRHLPFLLILQIVDTSLFLPQYSIISKMKFKCCSLTKKRRLIITISISLSFFLLELVCRWTKAVSVSETRHRDSFPNTNDICCLQDGLRTGSLVLVADAFHYVRLVIPIKVG